ncbi:MAG: efflux RND transporter periplasmic adaptor subunit [Candidatus Obscuribacterales bacterium]|nr:efflux RND transporter periplasmic adaptor subunit [Candidatus Obscuribacterales bacterium]
MNLRTGFVLLWMLAGWSILLLCGCSVLGEGEKESLISNVETKKIQTVGVISKHLQKRVRIPGELTAFRDVPIYPRVQGFVKSMYVDRGAVVKRGQPLVKLFAPELEAQYAESQAKLESASALLLESESRLKSLTAEQREAQAKLIANEAVYKRIQFAANTPGAVAETDLDEARQKVEGAQAHVQSAVQTVEAARSALNSQKANVKSAAQAATSLREMKDYLMITAPFDGVVTERNVHEGSLVIPTPSSKPMLRVQQTSHLRLQVPIPESAIAGVRKGTVMKFTVPAFTGKMFSATVRRIGHALDLRTRSMPVEADVENTAGSLEPGMYPEVDWEMKRSYPTLFVPTSAVATAVAEPFVIKIVDGRTVPVPVKPGESMGNLIEVVGDLKAGDEVVAKSPEELKNGMPVHTQQLSLEALETSSGHDAE